MLTFPGDGILVAFEGIDGAGKTTQARILEAFLLGKEIEVVVTKEPTTGAHGRTLRASARHGRLPAREELRLFLADRREHVQEVIRPHLARGAVVIVDRYYFSTVAYQGARGLDPGELLRINEDFAPQPDLLVLLDIAPAVGLARVQSRGDETDLFEDIGALTRSRDIFDAIDKPYALRLDGSCPMERLAVDIKKALYEGPLFQRLCASSREEGANYCGHIHSGNCEWLSIGAGFLPPLPRHTAEAVERAVQDGTRPVAQTLEMIIAACQPDPPGAA